MSEFAFRRIEFLLPEREKIFIFHTDRALEGKGFAIRVHQSSNCGPQDQIWMPLVPQRFPPRNFQFREPFDSTRLPCEVCRRQLEGPLESPRYPSKYPNNIHCVYHIERLPGFCAVEIHFSDFQIERTDPKAGEPASSPCHGDYLELDGNRFCGFMLNGVTRIIPFPVGDPSQVDLVLSSDQFVGGRGFKAQYKQLPCRATRNINSTTNAAYTTVPLISPITLNTNNNTRGDETKSSTYPVIRPRNHS